MTVYLIRAVTLTALADAIREKSGITLTLTPNDMVTAIRNLQTGFDIDLSSVTVTPETLGDGVIAINASGELIVGTAKFCNHNETAALGTAVLGIMKLGS